MNEKCPPSPDASVLATPVLSVPASCPATLIAGAVIVLSTLAAWHNSFSVPFLFDDEPSVVGNLTIQHLWPFGRVLSPPGGGITVTGRPLVNLSFALNYALGETTVRGYHVLNLAIHVLASLTLFGIVRRTLSLTPALRQRFGAEALPLALTVALLWAVHPLQTESVTYIVQRAESLMGLFYLLTLYCFIRGTESGAARWYTLAIGACLLGMASKEVMVSAPLIVLLYDRTFVSGTLREALRRRWRVYAGLAGTWLLLAWLVTRAGELGSQRAGFHASIGWWPYALTQLWAIAHYLWLSVWPHPLVFDYGTMLVTGAEQVVLPALVVAALAAGTLISLRRWPVFGFLGCCFFCILAPTSSVLPLAGQTVAEHRMYLPLAAVIVLGVLIVHAVAGRRSFVLFLGLAIGLGVLTARRNTDYRNAQVIWADTAAKRPDNPRARSTLGLARLGNGELDEAIADFRKALEIAPNYAEAHNNLASALLQKGEVGEAIMQFQCAVEIAPNFAEACNNLGSALRRAGHLDEAIAQFQKALEIKPKLAEAHYNLGNALIEAGRQDEALLHYQRAVEIKPDYAEAHNNLGNVLLEKGRTAEAIAHFTEALRLKPDYAAPKEQLRALGVPTPE